MADEVERSAGRTRPPATGATSTSSRELYRYEMQDFIDRNIDSPFDLLTPEPGPAGGASAASAGSRRRSRSTCEDPRTQRVFSFQSMYAGLSPYDALAHLRGHRLHGLGRRRLLPDGRHARGAAGAGRRRGEARRRAPLRHDGDPRASRATAAPSAVQTADGERIAADVVVLNPDLPVAYRDLLAGVDAARGRADVLARPASCCWPARPQAYSQDRAPQHPLRPVVAGRRSTSSSTGSG